MFVLVLLSLGGILIFLNNMDFTVSQEQIDSAFSELSYQPEFKTIINEDRTIHYVTVGDTSKPSFLFVHGSPGTWDNFLGFLSDELLLEEYHLIAVDRPGFGNSDYGIPERSLEKQSADILEVLKSEETSAILVGHSYGGPVIVRMAIDAPELVEGLIIVAGSVDPELEKTKWYQIPVHYRILSWMLPGFLYSTNEEILALKQELETMKPLWGSVTQPVSVIQGGKDNLVPEANAYFIEKMLPNNPPNMIMIPEMNHFVPWTNPNLIREEMEYIISQIND